MCRAGQCWRPTEGGQVHNSRKEVPFLIGPELQTAGACWGLLPAGLVCVQWSLHLDLTPWQLGKSCMAQTSTSSQSVEEKLEVKMKSEEPPFRELELSLLAMGSHALLAYLMGTQRSLMSITQDSLCYK